MKIYRYGLIVFYGACIFMASDALAENYFSLGVEGFKDHYNEKFQTVDLSGNPTGEFEVDTHSLFRSVTASYEHDYNRYFTALDGRYSSGTSDYKSGGSGTLNGDPEWETDTRIRTGAILSMSGGVIKPYIGLGWRYYFDDGKGRETTTGAGAYNRQISQIYIPVGLSDRFTYANWIFTPLLEGDLLAWGRVASRLGEVPGHSNVVNIQNAGTGFRAEFMMGQQYKDFTWEVGPFIRHWHIQRSDALVTVNNSHGTFVSGFEPDNTRLQYGLAAKITY